MEIRSPIAVHHTDTSEEAWDGPANEARLRTDGSEAYYKSAYAWQDPDGDPETKAAYKFIHHFIDGEGDVGAASTRGCVTGIAVLNGARGGTTIPEADRQGVYNHLAAHLRDADIEPPDLRAFSGDEREERSVPVKELRVIREDGQPHIVGYAAVFDVLSVELWGFREKIKQGAFKKTIQEADVRALWNHDTSYVLGRTKSGTLGLREDEIGLAIDITPPDSQWARDAMVSIDRGDVDQMSFGFSTIRDAWETVDNELIRTLEEVALFDVSPVTFPAYPQTMVQLRSISDLLGKLDPGKLKDSDRGVLSNLVSRIQNMLTAAPAEGSHPAGDVRDDVGESQSAEAWRSHQKLRQSFPYPIVEKESTEEEQS